MDELAVVTGGCGFIGSRIANNLVKAGFETIVFDDAAGKLPTKLFPEVEFHRLSIGSPEAEMKLAGLERRISAVFHCAEQQNSDSIVNNAMGIVAEQLAFLEICRKLCASKIITLAKARPLYSAPSKLPVSETDKETPSTLEAVNQLFIESHLRLLNVPWISLRLAEVYGPGQKSGLLTYAFKKILDDENFEIICPRFTTRDFIYIGDVVQAAMMAMDSNQTGIFNISSGQETRIETMLKLLKELTGSKSEVAVRSTGDYFCSRSYFSPKKAAQKIGWHAQTAFSDGIKTMV